MLTSANVSACSLSLFCFMLTNTKLLLQYEENLICYSNTGLLKEKERKKNINIFVLLAASLYVGRIFYYPVMVIWFCTQYFVTLFHVALGKIHHTSATAVILFPCEIKHCQTGCERWSQCLIFKDTIWNE